MNLLLRSALLALVLLSVDFCSQELQHMWLVWLLMTFPVTTSLCHYLYLPWVRAA